jgi:hypothetical protein
VNPFLSLVGTAALLAAPLDSGDAARRARYQKVADGLAWKVPASPFEKAGEMVEVILASEAGTTTSRVRFTDGDKELYGWQEDGPAAFVVRERVVYRADYHRMSTGCSVIAFELKAGKKLWQVNLKGMGPISHSKYRNTVRMEKYDDTAFAVYGDESAGKYVELVEYTTGRTLGHKVFPRE